MWEKKSADIVTVRYQSLASGSFDPEMGRGGSGGGGVKGTPDSVT